MSNSQKQITAGFILLDFNSKLLKNIEYKVTIVKNYKESHLVKGKTNSKGETYEFVKPINTNVCLYVKIGTKDFQKIACLPLPSTEKSKLKIRARVSAILIDSQLRKHGDSAGSIKRKDYQVVAGDTLEGIAKRHNTSVVELKNLNPKINNINKIYAGKWIKVPFNGGDKERSVDENTEANKITTITYKVKSGDTLSKIAERSGESVSDLEKINNISNRHEIREGQVLKINSKAQSSSEKNDKDWKDKINDGLDSLKDSVKDTVDNIKDKLGDLDNDTLGNHNPPASKPSIPTPTPTKPKVDIPDVELNKNSGNNQKGNPAEQITYDSKTTVYHIYYDGRIERANGQAVGYAAFIYYAKDGSVHNLGKSTYIIGDKFEYYYVKKVLKVRKVNNGKTYLIDQNKHSQYRKGNVSYQWIIFGDDERHYLSGLAMACVLGAMCSISIGKYTGTGFSTVTGSSGGVSKSHINGINGDFRYLGVNNKHMQIQTYTSSDHFDWNANVEFVEALYSFGYKDFKSQPVKIKSNRMLPHSGSLVNHHHHIHLQGFKPNIEDVDIIHPSKIIPNQKASIKELRVRAFMRMLRVGEGTVGDGGYERLFGGRSFVKDYSRGFSDHPRIDRPFGKKTSSAAGSYQVMGYTWDDKSMIAKRKKYGITSFGKRDQDLFAVILMKYARPSAWPLLLEGKIKEALELDKKRGYAYEWASLPPGRYGQPSKTMVQALGLYDKYFKEENNGKTDLHIEYGFLREVFND